ncbi:helix-turn-helix domain-containing protein [Streptomyces griseoviridis]|uniref:Helix-turn-helix domain-containing protein n=1 Tax=Streptomyces griseoviridis TaxID=45398 RepID=A0ABT9LF97_STRGD|nr:helix-turn-helix domain-containing protein [Streptomyces griseoviridis]MDP9682397.1 hypothetical protein [Streptomyces griseoviridis]GGS81766.1 hypothetical protein GCM10010240_13900 [Streptomyces griseoviridis]
MTKPRPHTPLRGVQRAEIARKAGQLYAEGCTIQSTADQIGRSYGAARTLILEAGVQLRRPGGAR